MVTIRSSAERGHANHGWLDSFHTFSFSSYRDPAWMGFGPLRVINEDRVQPGKGFGTHAHSDMEIISYVLEGELAHRDSMGNHGVVGPGGVQFMSAGTGVRHSEFNNDPERALHLVQMWVLPGTMGQAPSYGQMDFTIDDRRNRWLTIVSGESAVEAPIRITQAATFAVARVEGEMLVREFAPQRYAFLFVADGSVEVNGESLQKGDAVRAFDVARLAVKGHGELVLWDLPDAP